MGGDPYVRETQRRVGRYNARLFIVCLLAVAVFFAVVSMQSCGSGDAGQGDSPCQVGANCE